jgi:poly-gamma-glutamate synthesis protein (capsule biosynthesis protein)
MPSDRTVTLFLCGDVMTGRGVDQILAHPIDPRLHEPYVLDAREYVELAERACGPIPRPAEGSYIWGDALEELERVRPGARIVNLETSITRSESYWRGKGIHYRMHPENIGCLLAARLDVCVLANNHVLDFGRTGLLETLETLTKAGFKSAGAGRTLDEARRPVLIDLDHHARLIVFSFGSEDCGIPESWAAGDDTPGVALLADFSEDTALAVRRRVASLKRPGDIVVASIHWGTNWGYEVPSEHVQFARMLVDGGVDIVHGHSSHHVRPIEVYRNRLILYGCGDFVDDYEGIAGHEEFRDDLAVMYFATVESATGALVALRMTPMRINRFRLNRADPADVEWLRKTLERISAPFGSRVDLDDQGHLVARDKARTTVVSAFRRN